MSEDPVEPAGYGSPAAKATVLADPGPVPRLTEEHLTTMLADLSALRHEVPRLNAIIDRLHAENERLRQGETRQLLLPIYHALIKMSDDWSARGARWETREQTSSPDVGRICREAAEDAQLVLERLGVEVCRPTVGEPFDRRLHRAVAKQPTADVRSQDRIAHVRKVGYRVDEWVVRSAEVSVYVVDPALPADSSDE